MSEDTALVGTWWPDGKDDGNPEVIFLSRTDTNEVCLQVKTHKLLIYFDATDFKRAVRKL